MLAHALYLKAVHGGKTKNDRIDAHKIAALLRGGNIPIAYTYPAHMRATRDLRRRRTHLMRKRAELVTHIQNTASQYNLPSSAIRVSVPALPRGPMIYSFCSSASRTSGFRRRVPSHSVSDCLGYET